MISPNHSRPSLNNGKQFAAVATAAIPVVMLSSLALAQPATAAPAPAETKVLPASATLASHLTTAKSASKSSNVQAAVVAGSIPSRLSSQVQSTTPQSHTVVSGETISAIAAHYSLSTQSVLAANNLGQDSYIYPGQRITLTQAPASAPASDGQVSSEQATSTADYIIKSGDTLSSIAANHGVALQALADANNLSLQKTIYAGKSLHIPGTSTASSSVAPTSVQGLSPDQQVPNTFLDYTYPDAVVADANQNKAALLAAPAPTASQMQDMVTRTANSMGVDPSLALAIAQQESGFNHQSVSPANAIGTMQVIPAAGEWASGLVGGKLNLLVPQDNVTAGIAIIRALVKDAPNEDLAIAGYYQGQYSVSVNGMFSDTLNYVAGVQAKRNSFR